MKTTLNKLLLVAAVLAVNTSFANFRPGWERPMLKADLVATDGNLDPYKKELTRNKRDGAQLSTSFTLEEDTGIRCIQAPCPSTKTSHFAIVYIQAGRCQSNHYFAVEKVSGDAQARFLYVVDHKNRICEDGRPHRWDVKLYSLGGVNRFGGDPETLMTAMIR